MISRNLRNPKKPAMATTIPKNVRTSAVTASHQSMVFARSSRSSRRISLNRLCISTSTSAEISGFGGATACNNVPAVELSSPPAPSASASSCSLVAGICSVPVSAVCANTNIGIATVIAAAMSPARTPSAICRIILLASFDWLSHALRGQCGGENGNDEQDLTHPHASTNSRSSPPQGKGRLDGQRVSHSCQG